MFTSMNVPVFYNIKVLNLGNNNIFSIENLRLLELPSLEQLHLCIYDQIES